ncbi:MAG: helix-turn-helix domain-containing protein, partial [Paracraurococcus sp.]
MEDEIDHDDELPGSDAEPGSAERAKRLRQAVKLAGGGSAIARRIQMPLGTLSRYQRGREMKAGAMIALAEATGVRLEWLATGAGPMRAGELQAE